MWMNAKRILAKMVAVAWTAQAATHVNVNLDTADTTVRQTLTTAHPVSFPSAYSVTLSVLCVTRCRYKSAISQICHVSGGIILPFKIPVTTENRDTKQATYTLTITSFDDNSDIAITRLTCCLLSAFLFVGNYLNGSDRLSTCCSTRTNSHFPPIAEW